MRSTDSTTCLDGQILNLQSYAPTEQRMHTATRQHTHRHHQASPAAVRARWPSRWMPRKLELQPVEMAGGLPDRREEEEHWAVLPLSSAAWSIFSLGVPSSRVTCFFSRVGKSERARKRRFYWIQSTRASNSGRGRTSVTEKATISCDNSLHECPGHPNSGIRASQMPITNSWPECLHPNGALSYLVMLKFSTFYTNFGCFFSFRFNCGLQLLINW